MDEQPNANGRIYGYVTAVAGTMKEIERELEWTTVESDDILRQSIIVAAERNINILVKLRNILMTEEEHEREDRSIEVYV